MDRLGLELYDYHRCFQEGQIGPEDRPFAYTRQLSNMVRQWLQPGPAGLEAHIMEQVVMEQFMVELPMVGLPVPR